MQTCEWDLFGVSLDEDTDVGRRDALHHYLITTDIAPTVPPSHFDAATSRRNTRVRPTKMTLNPA